MGDLISREALLGKIGAAFMATDPKSEEQLGVLTCSKLVREMPAADAIEVVRCKDCVHAGVFPNDYTKRRFAGRLNCYLCRGDDGYGIANVSVVYPDDYCSDGVRREKKDGANP